MATAEQIKALIKLFSEGDAPRFYATALQIAAKEEKIGHSRLAEEIRGIVYKVQNTNEREYIKPAFKNDNADRSNYKNGEANSALLQKTYSKIKLNTMILSDSSLSELQRVILEYRQKDILARFGLFPRRKILLSGPPGTGKTLTAKVLATELNLSLYTIQFDALITRFLGETASKLRQIFDAISKEKAVYLFDEFDAIGAHRNSDNDVGEIRRVLNSFLTFLEEDFSESLIICATNNQNMLDSALFRRFDGIIKYNNPSAEQAKEAIMNRLSLFNAKNLAWDDICKVADGSSYADIAKACDDVAKDSILLKTEINNESIIKAIENRKF
ncbi:ATP-binding protein [Sodalis sp. dw_96]|uniref:AAA family ATPase n=1 Tax=Sodalis sp. dw_96 TaxID=2719794 RepID=UPI001BD3BF0B|nr:ATP-binding protein [Sodalis sp. dw_96]